MKRKRKIVAKKIILGKNITIYAGVCKSLIIILRRAISRAFRFFVMLVA